MEQQNISFMIFETINNLLNNLLTSIDTTLYEVLDELVFIDTNILKVPFFAKIFGSYSNNGLLLIANSINCICYILCSKTCIFQLHQPAY